MSEPVNEPLSESFSEPYLIERQRIALRELARLQAERTAALSAADQKSKAQIAAAERELEQARSRIASRLEAAQTAATQQHESAQREAATRYESESSAAERAYNAVREKSERRQEESQEKAEREHHDFCWTTKTVFEASEKTATAPLDKVQHEVGLARQDIEQVRQEAEETIRRWRHAGLLNRVRPGTRTNRHHENPQRNLSACIVDSRELLQQLKSLLVPRLFQGLKIAGIIVIVWALLSGVLAAIYPDGMVVGKYHWLLVSGGGAVLLGLAMAALLYVSARFKLYAIYKPLCISLGDAEATCERWLSLANKAHEQRMAEVEKARQQRDAKLQVADEKYQQALAAIQQQHEEHMRQAEARYPVQMQAAEQARDQSLRQAEAQFRQAMTESQSRADSAGKEAVITARTAIDHAERDQAQLRQKIEQSLVRALTKIRDDVTDVIRTGGRQFPPWKHPSWNDWKPPASVPQVIRFGEMQVSLQPLADSLGKAWPGGFPAKFSWPALAAFPQRSSLLFKARDDARPAAVEAIQAVMYRLLTSLPAGKVRFTIIDPVGLGENFSAFMHLADHDEALVSSRIWTEPSHIDQRLADLSAHMENVIQKYLRNQYASIEEYNTQAGEVAEPYRILVVANFPVNFTPTAARRLTSIITSGASCGVCTLLSADESQRMPDGFRLADLEPHCVTLPHAEGRFTWPDRDFSALPLQLDSPPDPAMANRLLHLAGEAAKAASRVEVPFDFIAPTTSGWWSQSSRDGIEVPLGRAGATKKQNLSLGQGTAQHGLVAGKTGSGKSTLFHVLITNLSLLYRPDEMELYLVDFKKGVEFKTYATHQLPHARVIAVESEREFGLSVLQRLDAELKQRGDTFRRAGVPNVKEYREKTKKLCPRILLLVDEFQEFFVEDDRIAQEAALLLDRLVRQGRAFGLHIVLGSQTLGGAYTLARSTIDQMAVRIALQCSEADAHLILSKDNAAARLLTRPGEAIYNDANGLVEGNNIFQIVWMADERRDQMLEQIRRLSALHKVQPSSPPVIFEGNIPADVRTNSALQKLLTAPTWPTAPRTCSAWLGEAIAIKEPTAAIFRRNTASNLLVIGQQEEAGLGLLSTALVSLASQLAPSPDATSPAAGVRFIVLDGTPADSPHAGAWSTIVDVLPHSVSPIGWRELPGTFAEIAAELDRRQKANDTESPGIFLFIHGLHRFKDLRRQEEDFSYSRRGEEKTVPPSKLFETILREGPGVGIHTLVWCDGLNSLQRVCDRAMLREFEMRVLFQMGVNDSSFLIDSPAAAKLGLHRALYCSEDAGGAEKFRPYGLPPTEWLQVVREHLKNKRVSAKTPAAV
jgi:DNA segregation ATPase FtsK/SpoIIIE, S-DNA-T family